VRQRTAGSRSKGRDRRGHPLFTPPAAFCRVLPPGEAHRPHDQGGQTKPFTSLQDAAATGTSPAHQSRGFTAVTFQSVPVKLSSAVTSACGAVAYFATPISKRSGLSMPKLLTLPSP
jgi:hypothetical protein